MIQMDYAKLESRMFRFLEITQIQTSLKEEKSNLKEQIAEMLQEEGLSHHTALFDENHELKVTVTPGTKKVFEKEKMADDLGVTTASTQKKDFLINMTEQGKLTLDRFKRYFHQEPNVKFSLRKVKKKKKKVKK
jgi:hypothetical protein